MEVTRPMIRDLRRQITKKLTCPACGAIIAEPRLAYLRRHASELVYDLRCRNGHQVLRTMIALPRVIELLRVIELPRLIALPG
jgi:hypothetical protein